jgi:transposase
MNNATATANLVAKIVKENADLRKENTELTAKVRWFEEQFRLSQKRRFGASSERTNDLQLGLFNEAEKEAKPLRKEPTFEEITYKRRKRKGHREAMLKDLPVETVEYELPEEERICSSCGGPLHEMSVEVRQEIKVIPAQVKVVKHVRHVYACRQCEKEELETPIVTAPMPNPPLKGSLASPSAMAYIMTQKYVYSLPLYRQEKQFSRMGLELPRQVMANWMIHGANAWLKPLYETLHKELLKEDILHADETTLQVLRESGRKAESKSYMWVYRTGRYSPPIVLYDYQQTRAGTHPREFLTGYKGYLHTDGYSGYNEMPDITPVGCWAHARRKFDEALKILPADRRSADVAARQGLEFCNELFRIERDLEDMTPDERYEARLKRSLPVLDAFLAWLNDRSLKALPKSAFGKAVAYCLNQWDKLKAFLKDGRLEISNNRSERAIKPFVIGRKNWLFSNTPRGAEASAIIYSIVETAKENRLDPFAYLCHVFEKMPNIDIQDPAAIESLLPYSTSLPETCKTPR